MSNRRLRAGAEPVVLSMPFFMPAFRALLIQVVAFALVVLLAFSIPETAPMQITVAVAALLQGMIAALLSRLQGLSWWWLLIQFLFPSALLLHAFHLPPWVFLTSFSLLLALYWTTFRTQVPFYPSNPEVWHAVIETLPDGRSLRFIDVGSGFGGLVMHLASRLQGSEFAGIEIAPLPWLGSVLRATLSRSRGRFLLGDYCRLDFGRYDVVFAYLSPVAMPALWRKARAEMRQGSLLLSYEFLIAGIEPDLVHRPSKDGPLLYGWYL